MANTATNFANNGKLIDEFDELLQSDPMRAGNMIGLIPGRFGVVRWLRPRVAATTRMQRLDE